MKDEACDKHGKCLDWKCTPSCSEQEQVYCILIEFAILGSNAYHSGSKLAILISYRCLELYSVTFFAGH